jgi:hypothetical protein
MIKLFIINNIIVIAINNIIICVIIIKLMNINLFLTIT